MERWVRGEKIWEEMSVEVIVKEVKENKSWESGLKVVKENNEENKHAELRLSEWMEEGKGKRKTLKEWQEIMINNWWLEVVKSRNK